MNSSLDGPQKHYAKRKEPDVKDYPLCYSTDGQCPEKTEPDKNAVAAWSWGGSRDWLQWA